MHYYSFLSLLCLTVLLSAASSSDGDAIDLTGCPKVFKERCHCGKQKYKYWKSDQEVFVVNCTNTYFNDTVMLETLPKQTEVLIFNGNNVPELDWNLFGIWDEHEKLEVVDLTNNRIREIPGKAFHKVKHVKRLVLDHNDLMISGPNLHLRLLSNFYNLEDLHLTNAFTETVDSRWYLSDLKEILLASNMTKLKKLHLEQNEIWEIKDDDMFCGLPALTDLYLGDNQLRGVDFSLECLEKIRYLDLQYNKIKRLDDKTLRKIEKVFAADPDHRMLNLKGNPFHCDCYLKNFRLWLAHTNISMFHKSDLRCYDGYPIANAGKKILNANRLDCAPPESADKSLSSAALHHGRGVTNGLLVTLIVLVIVVGAMVVYYNRQKLRDNVKPLVVSFQKSMQYKTIDKEEVMAEQTPPEVNV